MGMMGGGWGWWMVDGGWWTTVGGWRWVVLGVTSHSLTLSRSHSLTLSLTIQRVEGFGEEHVVFIHEAIDQNSLGMVGGRGLNLDGL